MLQLSIELAINIFGVMTAYWVDYGMSYVHDSSVQFRFPLALQCLFAIITLGGIMLLPESPRWVKTSIYLFSSSAVSNVFTAPGSR